MNAPVPRLWPGCTMVLLGDGPSLTAEDVDACRGRARVLAINYSLRRAPWADVLWSFHTPGLTEWSGVDPETFPGLIVSAEEPAPWPTVRVTGLEGIDTDPSCVRMGANSGHAAINLAVHLGARRIVLLGFDCCADEATGRFCWAKEVTDPTAKSYAFARWIRAFGTTVGPLRALGVEVLNASRRTALPWFPRVTLAEALPARGALGAPEAMPARRAAGSPAGAVAAPRAAIVGATS